jgi:hypothetical protein
MRCKYINWDPLLHNMGWPWKMMALLLRPNVIIIKLLPPFQRWSLFRCYITSAFIWLPMHFKTVMFEQFWWLIYLVTPLSLTSWLWWITSNSHHHDFNPQPFAGSSWTLRLGQFKGQILTRIFYQKNTFQTVLIKTIISTNVHLSFNINCPWQGQAHLMGTMNHEYHNMFRLLKLKRVHC